MNNSEIEIKLLSSGGEAVIPPVKARAFSAQDRLRLAMKRGGLFFGLAVVSVFIPVMHFFLVPLFLILTVLMALRARKTQAEVPPFEALCPNCKKPVQFQKIFLEQELRTFCPNCRDQLKLTLS